MNELNQLIEDFLKQYTFNNIDILLSNRKILGLDEESLEDKLIKRRRGGYCFENNQYFYTFLKKKGYEVNRYLGRVVYGGSNEVPRTHQLSIVTLNGEKVLADVGFGPYTPGICVPFSGEPVKAFNGNIYRLVKVNEVDYQLETLRDQDYFSLYQFDLADYKEADFKISNYFTNTHDDSKFTKTLMLAQLDPRGVKFISFLGFTTLFDGKREDLNLGSREEFRALIKREFNVSYSDDELGRLYEITKELEMKERMRS